MDDVAVPQEVVEQETVRNVIGRQFSLTTNIRELIVLLVSGFADP